MFEDGTRLDDIMNFFKQPTLNNDDDKKNSRLSDAAIRYESSRSPGDDTINFEFAGSRTSEVLR